MIERTLILIHRIPVTELKDSAMSTPKSETAEAKSPNTSASRLQELAEHRIVLARLVVRNESAMPDLLEQLSYHNDTIVRKWVCAHANTPPEALARLGGQFPQQLLDNPALDFMILENPNLLRELPQAAKTSMLKRQTCPASFIELMAQDMGGQEGMQMAIAMNPNTPAHVIQKLKKSYYTKVEDAARQHIHAGGSQKDEAALRNAVNHDLAESCKIVQLMPWAVAASLEQPGTAERDVLREVLMQKSMTDVKRPMTEGKLPRSSKPRSSKQAKSLAYLEGDELLQETFRAIKTFRDKIDYNALSAHLKKVYETLPNEQGDKLFDLMSAEQKQKFPGNFARNYAAILPRNPRPGFDRLLALMLDECPTPIIAKAVRSNDWLERLAIATHPKAPPNTLKTLCNDGNKWVRQAAENAIQQQEKAA